MGNGKEVNPTTTARATESTSQPADPNEKPGTGPGFLLNGCLTMTYFRMGNPHYHRRAAVSRSCSGWEGVVPAGCGRQALTVGRARCEILARSRMGEEVKHWLDWRQHHR